MSVNSDKSAQEPSGISDPVLRRIDHWKRKLIDLTKRNRLLNFKPTKVTTIQVVDELPAEAFRVLQLEARSMTFLALPEEGNDGDAVFVKEAAERYRHAASNPVEFIRRDRTDLAQHHTDTELQTSLPKDKLSNNLLRIYQKSTSLFEEQGVNTLFIALGMLEWFESDDSQELLKAPLLLLPVQILRKTAASDFSLTSTADDPILNPAIVEKLRLDFRIIFPELPESFEDFDPQDFFTTIQDLISLRKRWRVTEEIHLGLFSFLKFLMYKEMDAHANMYAAHTAIRAVCLGKGDRLSPVSEELATASLDEVLTPENTFHVLDADSSQQRAILFAKNGHDLVIEGPPGTGKSQTISNLIADALADGKSVLFVSEKMAALEVVYNRLKTHQLHDFCLELHSHKTNKAAVYEELGRVLDAHRPADHKSDSHLEHLGVLREHLNTYVRELHAPFGELKRTPFDVLGELSLLNEAPNITADILQLAKCNQVDLQKACYELIEHAKILSELGRPGDHPWCGSQLSMIGGAHLDDLTEVTQRASQSVNELIEKSGAYAVEIGARHPRMIGDIEVLCQVALSLAKSPGTSESLLASERWNSMSADAKELLEQGRRSRSLREDVLRKCQAAAMEADVSDLIKGYSQYCHDRTRFLRPKFWRDRKAAHGLLKADLKPANNSELLRDLQTISECQSVCRFICENAELGRSLFGDNWLGLDSDWDGLSRFAEWIVSVRQLIISEAIETKGIALAAGGRFDAQNAQTRVSEIKKVLSQAMTEVTKLLEMAKFGTEHCGQLAASGDLLRLRDWLSTLKSNTGRLHAWTIYKESLERCLNGMAGHYLQKAESDVSPDMLERAFRRLFYKRWLDIAFGQRPQLAKFHTSRHEERIKEFRDRDRAAIKLAQQRLLHRLYKKRDTELTTPDLARQLVTVQRELRKKSRHAPLRKLLARVPEIIKVIKPCFMMSPLSIAQFLDPKVHKFDLVVFDEASQITPEDAVGAVVRGQQIIVVGDPKQLPPTNFFSVQIGTAEDTTEQELEQEELGISDDVESILDEFASVGFPTRRLTWHYRSQHESLIAFSNHRFYDGSLLTFPGPDAGPGERGLHFVPVSGVYEGKGVNPLEAQAVVDAVCDHIRTSPQLSLGVGTFNIHQQQLILDELDRRRRDDPSLEFFFAEKGERQFFVKNLENIQGDDRDVILISVTYGPDSNGRIRYNFGPINGPNGWRRLNVILTRAKRLLKVFACMHGDQIDPTRAQSDGARLLRDFLIFAERGSLFTPDVDPEAEIESPFELSVFRELTKFGLRLIPQVGQSGYRIDFGVLDLEVPGRFVAGIECDGAMYHSAATARDRDRLRQQVLEELGWRLVRIWSTDWHHNKESEVVRVLKFVEECRSRQQSTSTMESDGCQSADEPSQLPAGPNAFELSSRQFGNFSVWGWYDEQGKWTGSFTTADGASDALRRVKKVAEKQTAGSRATNQLSPQKEAWSAPTNNTSARMPPLPKYQFVQVRMLGDVNTFAACTDSTIQEIVMEVVQCEAPIHREELRRRVASYWAIARTGARIQSKIDSAIDTLKWRKRLVIRGEFVWLSNQTEAIAKSRDLDSYAWKPEYISPEEWNKFVELVLGHMGPRTGDELTVDVARAAGFSRTGAKVAECIAQSLQYLLRNGRVEPSGTGYRLTKSASDHQIQ